MQNQADWRLGLEDSHMLRNLELLATCLAHFALTRIQEVT
jgi:hypothetical protein